MAASTTLQPFLYLLSSNTPPSPMYPLLIITTLSLLLLILLIITTFSLHRRLKKAEKQQHSSNSITQCHPSQSDPTRLTHSDSDLTQLTHSLLLEILPPNSPKREVLFKNCENPVGDEPGVDSERVGLDCGEKKRKKKRAKKKRPDSKPEDGGSFGEKKEEEEGLVCLYPFTTSSSATQRRIKQQYDQLVKCHESDGLTLAQVIDFSIEMVCVDHLGPQRNVLWFVHKALHCWHTLLSGLGSRYNQSVKKKMPGQPLKVGQFVNCLIEARNELQHKSDAIQRKFTITKALLFKADRSSFDRLRQQIYKLELEQKRLEEDAFVYNWLQKQLKLSPAYKKMLEIGACMELQAKSGELTKTADSEFEDTISFEELLAQEKKDSFWQKKGKPKTCSG